MPAVCSDVLKMIGVGKVTLLWSDTSGKIQDRTLYRTATTTEKREREHECAGGKYKKIVVEIVIISMVQMPCRDSFCP